MYHSTGIPEFEALKEYLIREKNGRIQAGGKECVIRCPWCGDSRDKTDAHLYVGPSKKNNMAISYNCFLCGQGDAVAGDFFRMINCYDADLIAEVIMYNKVRCGGVIKQRNQNKQRMQTPPAKMPAKFSNFERSLMKLNYINSRLGTNYSFEELAALKVCISLKEFLKQNHIRGLTRDVNIVQQFENFGVGFLSVNNTYMVMRTVDGNVLTGDVDQRYNNYLLIPHPNQLLFYVIPSRVDATRPMEFYICEGPFDALGLYNMVGRKPNTVIAACCGKGRYTQLMTYFFTQAYIPPALCTIHMCIDKSDDGSINLDQYKGFFFRMNKLHAAVHVHVNDFPGEKDFGVSIDRIQDRIVKSV